MTQPYLRTNGRKHDELRPVIVTRNYIQHAEGSVLIECGNTKIICTASVENKVPPFLKGSGKGWITAEYGMLPRSTSTRLLREATKGKQAGRTIEIQRLIGRSFRAVTNLSMLGERTIYIDCDVIQADGGTRTTAITGGFIALTDAIEHLLNNKTILENPISEHIAAISVGKVNNTILLDLNYEEDSQADVDMNFVITQSGNFVELQGTGEESVFTPSDLAEFIGMAQKGVKNLIEIQKNVLKVRS